MNGFIEYCIRISPLSSEAIQDLNSCFQKKSFKKDEYLLKRRGICRNLYFIDQGMIKLFFVDEEKEFIMRFFPNGMLCTSFQSFISQHPSKYMLQALEPTQVTYISREDLELLCQKYHCVETFYRKLSTMVIMNMMGRVSEMLEEDATKRYNNFVAEQPKIMQRISLGDVASYLGITQVSLSRIRAKK